MRPIASPRRRIAAWFGITALVLQALVPFAQALPGPGDLPLVICKVAGLGSSTTSSQPQRGALPGSLDGSGCVVCFAASSAKIGNTDRVALPPITVASVLLSLSEARPWTATRDPAAFHPRAPPVA